MEKRKIIPFILFSLLILSKGLFSDENIKDYYNRIDFSNTKWTLPKKSYSFDASIHDGSLKVKAENVDKAYIATSSGSVNSLPKESESIDLQQNQLYTICLKGTKDADLRIRLWVIMYDSEKRIGHSNYFINFDNAIIFKPLANAQHYRILLDISGSGNAEIENIEIKRINLRGLFTLKEDKTVDYYFLVTEKLRTSNYSIDDIATLLSLPPSNISLENILLTFFPKAMGKKIIDTGITQTESFKEYLENNKIDKINIFIKDRNYTITEYPINWDMDPFNDRNWQWYFQYLFWVKNQYINNNEINLNIAAYFINDWVNSQLYCNRPSSFTFEDHSLAKRFEVLHEFVSTYIDSNEILDIHVLQNSMNALLTHIYALASDAYYPDRIPYNHGLFMDVYLFKYIDKYPQLSDMREIEIKAEQRMIIQFTESYSKDFVHIENSPSYHYLVTESLKDVFEIYQKKNRQIPQVLRDIYIKAIYNTIFFIQPNNTYVQFGDTPNRLPTTVYKHISNIDPNSVDNYNEITFVYTQGKIGNKPLQRDRVFQNTGYAIFRDKWHNADSYVNMITGHFTCSNISKTHYHEDEFSFSLYGYGTEIIVDSGMYNYNYDEIYNKYRYSAYGHNVLLIDDEKYSDEDGNITIDNSSHITSSYIGDEYSWVKATHQHYKRLGIKKQTRIFAHYKPDTFIIVDEIYASSNHKYTQSFHFHPDFTEFDKIRDGIYVISSIEKNKPRLLITTGVIPTNVIINSGFLSKEQIWGWYFPEFNQKEKCTLLSLEYDHNGTDICLPVLLRIIPPNTDLYEIPTKLTYSSKFRTIQWNPGDEDIFIIIND